MKHLLFTVLLISFFSTVVFSQKKKIKEQHQIVYQLSSGDTLVHKALIRQLGNILDYWQTAQIEVVVHNNGVSFMKQDESRLSKEISELNARGIIFAVCENTLKQRKIDKSQILPTGIFVPVGLAEIVLKQEAGWVYIKAGF